MTHATILIVDDEPQIRRVMKTTLTSQGYAVIESPTGDDALEKMRGNKPDLVLLDVNMPGRSGLEICREIRESSDVPIIMLTVRNTERDKVQALDAGADDYVVKPFGGAQLDARIRAVLRRAAEPAEEPVLEVGGLRVDRRSRQASLDGAALDLTPREFDLLHYLAARAGAVVTKQELLVEVWQQPYGGADKSVDVHLSWLRRKLGENAQEPRYLHTVRRVGVRLAAPAEPG
jgi:DNA-binding response OmpR family regulator